MSNRVRALDPSAPGLVRGGYDWGSSPTTAQLPNVGTDGLEVLVGDVATVGAAAYLCTTATSGSAVWAKQGNDADIVTAQADATLALAGGARATIHMSASAETSIVTVDTPVKVAGTTAFIAGTTAVQFTHTDNRLTYTGSDPVTVNIMAGVSLTAVGNNKSISFYIARNGAVVVGSEAPRKIGTGSDEGRLAVLSQCDIVTDDYLELWVENTTDSANVTVTAMTFRIG